LNIRTFTKRDKDKASRAIVLFASPVAELRERLILGLQNFFTIQEATEWEELERAMASVRPSVLLLDLALLPPEGIGSISAIQRLSPSTKIILLSSVCDEKEAISALKSGAKGFCHKDIEPSMLKKAIKVVQKGEVWAGCKIISHLLSEIVSLTENRQKDPPNLSEVCLDYLTPREFQIARMVGNGAHNKEIAHRLNITERTVKAHLTAIFNKLQIPDRLRLGLFIANHNRNSVSPRPPRRKRDFYKSP
jgi:DNA-binding NarL/FixJ family response regulator